MFLCYLQLIRNHFRNRRLGGYGGRPASRHDGAGDWNVFYNVDGGRVCRSSMDPNALAEAIKKLLTDRELASRMGFAARKRADDFDLSRMLGSYLDLYDDLLSGRL